MLFWLLVIILSYLFFSLSAFGDKLILAGRANARLYTFYVGLLSVLIVFLIPFTKFGLPNLGSLLWIILEAIVWLLGVYAMFIALERFDVSRVMTTIGAVQSIFVLVLTWIVWGFQAMTAVDLFAFVLLLAGSIVISIEKKVNINAGYVILIFFSSLMFSLDYIFSKFVFLNQPFLQGLIWMRIFGFIFALFFLFDKKIRKQLLLSETAVNKKTGTIFLFTQSAGGIANILQSFAISLAPVAYLAIVSSLRGIQYAFLFVITLFFSVFFPKVLKEDISKKVIFQKLVSIALIIAGLAMLR